MQHVNRKGQVFTLVRTEPYVNRQGNNIVLNVWESICAHPGCANMFNIRTPSHDTDNKSQAFYGRHCDNHKTTPTSRRLVNDADVAEIRQLAAEGIPHWAIALVYPVAEGTVRAFVEGRRR